MSAKPASNRPAVIVMKHLDTRAIKLLGSEPPAAPSLVRLGPDKKLVPHLPEAVARFAENDAAPRARKGPPPLPATEVALAPTTLPVIARTTPPKRRKNGLGTGMLAAGILVGMVLGRFAIHEVSPSAGAAAEPAAIAQTEPTPVVAAAHAAPVADTTTAAPAPMEPSTTIVTLSKEAAKEPVFVAPYAPPSKGEPPAEAKAPRVTHHAPEAPKVAAVTTPAPAPRAETKPEAKPEPKAAVAAAPKKEEPVASAPRPAPSVKAAQDVLASALGGSPAKAAPAPAAASTASKYASLVNRQIGDSL